MILRLAQRLLRECAPRVLWKFARLFCWPNMFAMERFAARRRRGELFPAFLFISLTTRCQLFCRGCWVPHPG
ncbi:MAG: radical SAM protein, partial [Planctomycetota bacterium]|nr:radical SAM protein [Planctomycetota bacterium]